MANALTQERPDTALGLDEMPSYAAPALVSESVSVVAQTEVITAQRVALPRDYGRIMGRLKVLAAMAGEEWYYRFPVRNRRENRTDYIEGPSVKCATAVAREYGNCALDCRSIDQGSTTLFLARFVDLETGFQLTRPFQQRKSQQTLRGDADRNADIVYQIGASKATRNVVCNALEMFTNYAFEQAKASLIEKVGKKLDDYRAKVISRLKEMEVDLARVERILGKTAKEWLAPEVARLIAEIQAIHDGMANKDDLYPPIDTGTEEAKPTGSKLDQFNDVKSGKSATKATEFIFTDGEGEVRTFDNPDGAVSAFRVALRAASDIDALTALWESNTLSGQLRDASLVEMADAVQAEYVAIDAALLKARAAEREKRQQDAAQPAQGKTAAPIAPPRAPTKNGDFPAYVTALKAWLPQAAPDQREAYMTAHAREMAFIAENRTADHDAIMALLDELRR